MARDYGRIRSQFWNDEKVKQWPLDVKAVASYLLTCEHATALGAFRLPAAYMSDDLDITPSQALGYLAQLESLGFIKVCKTGWIWIVNYLRHNRPENANVWKHVRGLANAIPGNVGFRQAVLDTIERRHGDPKETIDEEKNTVSEPFAKGSETVSNNKAEPILTEPIRTQPNPTKEGALDAPPPPPPPTPPTPDRRGLRLPPDWQPDEGLIAFAVEQGFRPDRIAAIAEQFRDYWHAVAGAKGRKLDWDATWRNWVRRDAEGAKNGGNAGQSRQSAGRQLREIQLAAALEAAGGGRG